MIYNSKLDMAAFIDQATHVKQFGAGLKVTANRVLACDNVQKQAKPSTTGTQTGCACKAKHIRREIESLQRRVKKLENNRSNGGKKSKGPKQGTSGALLKPVQELRTQFETLTTEH